VVGATGLPALAGKLRLSRNYDRTAEPTSSFRVKGFMHTNLNIFDKPIDRIRKTCELMGLGADFERRLPELETHLEALVAEGETSAERLAVSGLAFLKQSS
jgi:hypothetical protein